VRMLGAVAANYKGQSAALDLDQRMARINDAS
jgi:hypothetical protein